MREWHKPTIVLRRESRKLCLHACPLKLAPLHQWVSTWTRDRPVTYVSKCFLKVPQSAPTTRYNRKTNTRGKHVLILLMLAGHYTKTILEIQNYAISLNGAELTNSKMKSTHRDFRILQFSQVTKTNLICITHNLLSFPEIRKAKP